MEENKITIGQNDTLDHELVANTFDKSKSNAEYLYDNIIYPNLLTRVKALFVDFIVILIIFSITSLVIGKIGGAPNWVRGFILVFSLYLYEPVLISSFGGTVGHHLVKIRIKRMSNPDKKLNIFQASLRFIVKYLLGVISFLTITGNKKKRAIHDMASGSIVTYKH